MRRLSKYLFAFFACVILFLYSVYIFKPSPLKSTLLKYGKLDEVQGALENDDDVFSPWNFEDKLMSNAIKAGNTGRMKKLLKKALGGEDINLVVLGWSNSAGGCFGGDEAQMANI